METQTERGDALTMPESLAWRGLLRVHSALMRELDADLVAAHGLPLRSYEVLLFLAGAQGHRLRMTELSESVLLTASGVSRLVDRLEERGLVTRERCDLDGRGLYAVITRAGLDKFHEARATHLAGVRRLFVGRLTPDELAALSTCWDRVIPGLGDD